MKRCIFLVLILSTYLFTPAALAVTESDILALEISGELLPPPALKAQIDADLAAIRAQYPYFDMVGIVATAQWEVGVVIVQLTEAANQQYLDGTYTGLDALNAQYGPVTEEHLSSIRLLILRFEAPYHPQRLAEIYTGAEGVELVSTSQPAGDGSDIDSTGPSEYVFDLGWEDCLAGCLYHHYWRLQVVGGVVTLLESYGDPVTVGTDPALSGPVVLHAPSPNPFSDRGRIGFTTTVAGRVDLRVYDLAGRLVKVLLNEEREPGTHWTSWDGRDRVAQPVASGIYILRLQLGTGAGQLRRLVVLR